MFPQPRRTLNSPLAKDIRAIYLVLFKHFGPQHWWPGETPFEIIVGAVLTQNTNWSNVEQAIHNLRREGLLTIKAMQEVSVKRLAGSIGPAGYFNVKARRLKNVVSFIMENYGGSLKKMKEQPLEVLRRQWLAVHGVGPETADSILLYALGKPVFVVDAYTRRFMMRHNMIAGSEEYHDLQYLFLRSLSGDVELFNEYHALIVRLGKEFCKSRPKCEECPLKNIRYDINRRCAQCYRTLGEAKGSSYGTQIGKRHNRRLCRDCGNDS